MNHDELNKLEYDHRDDLHGITYKTPQPKLRKKVRCITDDVTFDSIKDAAKYYNILSANIVTSIKDNSYTGKRKVGRPLYFEYVKKDV